MYTRPTAPKTIGGVLDDTFKLFSASWGASFALAFMAAIVGVAPSVYAALSSGGDPATIAGATSDPGYLIITFLGFAIGTILNIAIMTRINAVANGTEVSVADGITIGARLFPRAFGAGILYALCVAGGVILLVVPGIFLSLALAFYTVMIVTQNARVVESLKASRALTKGNWWRVAAVATVILIIALAVFFIVGAIGGVIGAFSGDLVTSMLVIQAISLLAYLVFYPLANATLLTVYFDLKLRTEGGDLSERVDALSST